ncbi:hypothetical protein LIER_05175 [Lithospermum erythrorhizon]|uniref:GAG-pre-integrase domain-containing protein n=1 Tax=Lithospermum erythrorhizon TaxID=34254 RepID=A0AAV3P493_LITER
MVYCEICSKPGHTSLKCYQMFNQGSSVASNAKAVYFASTSNINDPTWYVDSGTSNHLTSDLQNLSIHTDYSRSNKIIVGNGHSLAIDHIGKAQIPTASHSLALNNVLHVPKITKNLLSVSQFNFDNNVHLEFHPFHCYGKDHQGQIVLKGTIDQGLYKLETLASSHILGSSNNKASFFALVGERTSASIWHNQLGHPTSVIVNRVLALNNVLVVGSKEPFICTSCQMSKSHKFPFQESSFESSFPL